MMTKYLITLAVFLFCAPAFANQSPQADAGEDLSVRPGASVTLDGSGSYDPDDTDVLTYLWQETTSGSMSITDPTLSTITVTAPKNPGTYVLKLFVEDGQGGLDSDEMTLTVASTAVEADIADGAVTDETGENFEGGSSCSLNRESQSPEFFWAASVMVMAVGAFAARGLFQSVKMKHDCGQRQI